MGVKDSSRLVEEERNAGSRLPSSTLIPAGCLYVLIFRFNLQPAVRDFQRRQRRGETDSSRLLEHNSRQQAWLRGPARCAHRCFILARLCRELSSPTSAAGVGTAHTAPRKWAGQTAAVFVNRRKSRGNASCLLRLPSLPRTLSSFLSPVFFSHKFRVFDAFPVRVRLVRAVPDMSQPFNIPT